MAVIFVVEGSESWRLLLRRILVRAGHNVTVLVSVPDIIEAFVEVGRPGLLVIGASLSDGAYDRQGCEVLRRVGDNIPSLCISSRLHPDEVSRWGFEGRFFDKGEFVQEDFLRTVEAFLIPPRPVQTSAEAALLLPQVNQDMWTAEEVDMTVRHAVQPYEHFIRTMKIVFGILLVEIGLVFLFFLLEYIL